MPSWSIRQDFAEARYQRGIRDPWILIRSSRCGVDPFLLCSRAREIEVELPASSSGLQRLNETSQSTLSPQNGLYSRFAPVRQSDLGLCIEHQFQHRLRGNKEASAIQWACKCLWQRSFSNDR